MPTCIEPSALDELFADIKAHYARTANVAGICNGRLTLTSGTAVTTSDVTAATTVYFTPHQGSKIALYTGSIWKLYAFTEISLALGTITSDRNYDVFLYDNSGTLTLELSSAWNADHVTRTDALTLQDGIYVKSGATTRRYLGTIRTTSTTTTEDSRKRRFAWNLCGQVPRMLLGQIPTASWSYATNNTFRASANGNTTDGEGRVAFVVGLASEIAAEVYNLADASAGFTPVLSIGLDTLGDHATGRGQPSNASSRYFMNATYVGAVGIGYHLLQSMENVLGAGAAAVFYGTNSGPFHAIKGEIRG